MAVRQEAVAAEAWPYTELFAGQEDSGVWGAAQGRQDESQVTFLRITYTSTHKGRNVI